MRVMIVAAKINVPEGRLTTAPALACPTNSRPTEATKLSNPVRSSVAICEPAVPWPR